MEERNRALDGDKVVVEVLDRSQWMVLQQDAERDGVSLPASIAAYNEAESKYLQPKGRVVAITEKVADRIIVGTFRTGARRGRKILLCSRCVIIWQRLSATVLARLNCRTCSLARRTRACRACASRWFGGILCQ
jgi:exoribonuclease R